MIKCGVKNFQTLVATVLVMILTGNCGSQSRTEAGRTADMFETNLTQCPVRYANYQRNSFQMDATSAIGKLRWERAYSLHDDLLVMLPLNLLVKEDYIGVRSANHFLLYDHQGGFRHDMELGLHTPVVFGDQGLAYFGPSNLLNFETYGGETELDMKDIMGLHEYSRVLLFKPSDEKLLVALQFHGSPQRTTRSYDIFTVKVEERMPEWQFRGDGVVDRALLTNDLQTMAVVRQSKVTLLDCNNGSIVREFDLPFEEVTAAALDLDDNLVVIADKETEEWSGPVLELFDLTGASQWSANLNSPHVEQPPCCGSDGQIFVIDSSMLKCLAAGELKWEQTLSGNENVWLTATKDALICIDGLSLRSFDGDGEQVFSIEITKQAEEFHAPPALNSDGHIYVAGTERLYCFE